MSSKVFKEYINGENMRKNNGYPFPYSLFTMHRNAWNSLFEANSLLDKYFPLKKIDKLSDKPARNNLRLAADKYAQKCTVEAREGISQIQDPLWHRVCIDVLQVLGPVAFKNLWKSKITMVSAKEKKVYFTCPDQTISDTLEEYHFVIIDALKKFYPFLSSMDISISKDKRERQQRPQISTQ